MTFSILAETLFVDVFFFKSFLGALPDKPIAFAIIWAKHNLEAFLISSCFL